MGQADETWQVLGATWDNPGVPALMPSDLLPAYIAEYGALRDEVLSALDTQRQLLGLELAVIGVALSGAVFLQAQPALYLIGALLLGFLSWIMAEQTLKIQHIYRYIRDDLARQVLESVADRAVPGQETALWSWIDQWLTVSPRTVGMALLASAKFLLGFVLALALCVLFVAAERGSRPWSTGETILFGLNVLVLVVAAVMGALSGYDTAIRPWLGRRRDQNRREARSS
jgi:hypothetical protein